MGDSNFVKDTRTPCKYGADCYQKNPFHLSKFKHPLKRKDVTDETHRPQKIRKIEKREEKFTNNVSDSEEDTNEVNDVVTDETNKDNNWFKEDSAVDTPAMPGTSTAETTANEIKICPRDEKENRQYVSEKQNGMMWFNKEKDTSKNNIEIVKERNNKDVNVEFESLKGNQCNNLITSANGEALSKPKANILTNFDKKEFIKSKFLVEMPSDFYDFWEFCKKINKDNPLFALKEVGLTLVGPFDVLADKFNNVSEKGAEEYLVHWRYYFDVPEFQTILKGDDSSGYHIGYFRDSPNELPVFLASNKANTNGIFYEMGDNIFAAVSLYLADLKKTGDPFKKMHISKFVSLLKIESEKLNLNLSSSTQATKSRNSKIVTRTFNKIGLVVPYNKKTQVGYRELALSDRELKPLLDKLAVATPEQKDALLIKLQPVLTYASIAVDECDFGTSIELGWDILYCGVECLNATVSSYLATAYRLLNRDAFALIIEAHMKNRRKGSRLSIL